MCEMLAVASPRPEPLAPALSWARAMEHFGIAGFGWGVAWLSEDGEVLRHRDPRRLAEDPDVERLGHRASTRLMIHLRRPTLLSTVQLADTQPFVADRTFAFCHNGRFDRHEEYRPRFADRLAGHADSEVGFRLFEALLAEEGDPARAMERTATELGGPANLLYLGRDGALVVRPGHPGNRIWRFSLNGLELAATELHSLDSSLFDLVFGEAGERRILEGVEQM